MAPCGCGKKTKYLVTKPDGSTETVDTLTAAVAVVRKHPGSKYQRVKVDK